MSLVTPIASSACDKATCNPKECGADCGCGCKNDNLFKTWQFWLIVTAVVALAVGATQINRFDKNIQL